MTRERVLVSRPEPVDVAEDTPAPPRPRRRVEKDAVAVEIDRVLDKISAEGIESLTDAERSFLNDVSSRRRQDH